MSGKGCYYRRLLSASILIALAGCSTSTGPGRPPGSVAGFSANRALSSNLDLARSEFGRGNYGSAIEYLEKELAQKPASVSALNGLGACYDQLGRFDVAQRYYFRALDLAPESSQTLSNIGYSYLQQGRHDEAVAVLELALQKNDANQVAVNNLKLARAGLAPGAEPVQVARSTNNGSEADRVDFQTLFALLGQDSERAGDVSLVADQPETDSTVTRPVAVASAAQPATAITRSVQSEPGVAPAASSRQPMVAELDPGDTDSEHGLSDAKPEVAPVLAADLTPASALAVTPISEPAVAPQASPVSEPTRGRSLAPATREQPPTRVLLTETTAVITPVPDPAPAVNSEPAIASTPVTTPPLTLTIVDTPLQDPARASDVRPSLALLAKPLNLVIENGNGVRGIARATSNWLRGEKLDIKRIGDAGSFDYASTVIYYRPELAPYAQEIAASLNLSCDLRPSNDLAAGADVRVVLGHDFASQVSVNDGGIAFESRVSSDYLLGVLRLEVANGNGVNGMAARVRDYLQARGGNVVRISDAESYQYQETLLFYRSGTRIAAEALAASLPLPGVRIVESERLRPETDAQLVIGNDFVPFDNLVLN